MRHYRFIYCNSADDLNPQDYNASSDSQKMSEQKAYHCLCFRGMKDRTKGNRISSFPEMDDSVFAMGVAE